ncbi:hypothetical protein LEP1GSC203_0355 [Leptospira terpstrae serovar Hualin str. LT 11-33 = ATCC 700639]|uniref:Uncharacterized protein n=1 Tax=Leptospira terpstrae serovar Hualin str. LT 11-33 = ATCC 700639 TaxID=1257025 RepID=N1VLU6_9LEPT|nr:hypothetical protein LEP1GSC203_0355 [Leptospira terpstrae serovar Hualin str. LT 11-33 = ATCC 700639]
MVTQKANSKMMEIHNGGNNPGRQPIILRPENVEAWLDPRIESISDVTKLASFYENEDIIVGPENSSQPSLF